MKEFTLIKDKQEFIKYMDGVEDTIVFDTETTGLKIDSLLLGISLYDGVRPACFVPTDYFFSEGLPIKDIKSVCQEYFPKIKVGIAHNGKFDLGVFKVNEIPDIELKYDTASMVHLYNPDLLKQLETRIKEDFGYDKPTFKTLVGKKWDKIDWVADVKSGLVKLDVLARYACEDVYYTLQLFDKYYPLLEKDNLLKLLDKIEMPIIKVLRDMYVSGVLIDVPLLKEMGATVDKVLRDVTTNIYNEAGCEFNLNSPKQKADVLFGKMKLKSTKLTKSGAASTDADVLEELALKGHAIAGYMVEYSEVQKLNSGYIQAIPEKIDFDGRLRAGFNSNGTKTGRFSSSDPNLQNQPNNPRFPVRKAFIPKDLHKLICADYSQIEPRIMTHLSQDPKLIDIYHSKGDIYIGIAMELGITRPQAKVVQLAISYGLGPDKLALQLGVSKRDAEKIIEEYYIKYGKLAKYKKGVEDFTKKNGYVKTMYGRIRRLPGVFSSNKKLYYGSLRQAFNTNIQGSAADVIKMAMIKLHRQYEERGHGEQMLLQVHDELVNEVPDFVAEESLHLMEQTMSNVVSLSIPLEVEGRILNNWSEMKQKEYTNPMINYVPKISINENTLIPLWQTML